MVVNASIFDDGNWCGIPYDNYNFEN